MKNYEKLFADTQEISVKHLKKNNKFRPIFFMVIMPILLDSIIGIALYFFAPGFFTKPDVYIPFFVLTTLVFFWAMVTSNFLTKSSYNPNKKLETEANLFVATTVMDDLINALESFGTLNPEAKTRIVKLTEDYSWFDDGKLDLSGFDLNYTNEEERLIIEKEGHIYYLTNWDYGVELPFIFTFDKVDVNTGQCEKIEFHISIE